MKEPLKIAIIGFGFCGSLSLFHLIEKSKKPLKIFIFEKEENFLGPAFHDFDQNYTLNVPVKKMSAFSDDPLDFHRFLDRNYPELLKLSEGDGYMPRKIYGEYLSKITSEILEKAKSTKVEIIFIKSEVVEIKNEFEIKTLDGSFVCDYVLMSNSFSQKQLRCDFDNKNLIKNLWNKNYLYFHKENFSDDKKICLIGSGLSAVDILNSLKKKNFKGKIFVISRCGNFPKKHFSKPQKLPDFNQISKIKSDVLLLFLEIKKFLHKNTQYDLRHVVDCLRPITTTIWQSLDLENKKRFLRFSSYWNIFRHRAPEASINNIEEMVKGGQIQVLKGSIKKIERGDNAAMTVFAGNRKIDCDYVVNCLGFDFDPKNYILFRQMIDDGLLSKDVIFIKSNNSKLKLIGGLAIGEYFECTSVPDLRLSVEREVDSLIGVVNKGF